MCFSISRIRIDSQADASVSEPDGGGSVGRGNVVPPLEGRARRPPYETARGAVPRRSDASRCGTPALQRPTTAASLAAPPVRPDAGDGARLAGDHVDLVAPL